MVPQAGDKIGPYEILGRLGSGGMGLVFSAWDSRLHRDVAIKLLRDEYITPSLRARFLGEARAASRLNHPNICTIFDIGEQDGSPYLVMELLKGETLRGRMQRGIMSAEDILCVAEDVADALSVAHGQGIIHRDIKPANIVLVEKPGGRFQTKVLDFGLAKIEAGDGELTAGLTSTGMTVGTVSYMSPEQARGEALDRRSDLFSLGVVLYEMATGELPFTAATSALFFVRLLNEPASPVRERNASIPRPLEALIGTLLQKDRKARFQTAEEMVQALHKISLSASSEAPERQEKGSWLTRFTGGARRPSDTMPASGSELPPGPPLGLSQEASSLEPDSPARTPVPGDAFLRPVKRKRGSGSDPVPPAAPGEPSSETPGESPDASSGESPIRSVSPVGPVSSVSPPSPSGPPSELPFGPLPEIIPPDPLPARDITPPSRPALPMEDLPRPRLVLPKLTAEQLRNPSPRFQRVRLIEEPEEEEEGPLIHRSGQEADSGRWRILIGVLLALLAIVASLVIFFMRRKTVSSTTPRTVVLTSVTNHTGDNSLNGVLSAGLELSLEQSPRVELLNGPDFATPATSSPGSDPAFAQRAAQSAGAAAFMIGNIQNDGPAYSISLSVLDTGTGQRIGRCDGTAASRERIVGAIDSLATNLRSVLGEPQDSISRTSLPLNREATSDLEALRAYASGEQSQAGGRLLDAMYEFEHAAALSPQFTQAHLRLVEIFRRQHAEVSAATAASRAQASAASAGERTRRLAQAVSAMDADGDYPRAVELLTQLHEAYPFDLCSLNELALAQRLQGDFAGSLGTSVEALHLAPQDLRAGDSAEFALLGLNRLSEASQLAAGHSASLVRPAADIFAAIANPGAEGSSGNPQTIAAAMPDDLGLQTAAASALDANGQFHQGLVKWKEIAERASATPELASSASYALGQGALDHAMASDCVGSMALLQSGAGLAAGQNAIFSQGAASGLCGFVSGARRSLETLNGGYAQAFAVRSFYLTDLNALVLWKSGLASDALVTLESAKDYDRISLSQYLAGLVYFSDHQPQPANVEFQSILRQRGATTIVNPEAYPLTQLAMARAFAANGDSGNASRSYNALLALWPHADANNPLVAEARGMPSGPAAPPPMAR